MTWFEQRVLVPDKHGVHFLVLEGISNFLTLPFSIRVPLIMKGVLDFVAFYLFLAVSRFLRAYQLFLIAHQQVSGRNFASKISLSVLLSDGQNLSW